MLVPRASKWCRCAALLGAVLVGLAACHKPTDPPDPGLALEDFGSGVRLLASADAAQHAATDAGGGLEVKVVSPDDLARSTPYEAGGQRDLLLAVVGPVPPAASPANGASLAENVVSELRCYIAASPDTRATLLGHPLSGMTIDNAREYLGAAGTLTTTGGARFLEFTFADKLRPALRLRLMLSFHTYETDQSCFAARLYFVNPPPKF